MHLLKKCSVFTVYIALMQLINCTYLKLHCIYAIKYMYMVYILYTLYICDLVTYALVTQLRIGYTLVYYFINLLNCNKIN